MINKLENRFKFPVTVQLCETDYEKLRKAAFENQMTVSKYAKEIIIDCLLANEMMKELNEIE